MGSHRNEDRRIKNEKAKTGGVVGLTSVFSFSILRSSFLSFFVPVWPPLRGLTPPARPGFPRRPPAQPRQPFAADGKDPAADTDLEQVVQRLVAEDVDGGPRREALPL